MAKKGLSLAAIALAVLLVIPLAARAEPYVAVYGGGAFSGDRDIDFDLPAEFVTGEVKDVDFDSSAVWGGKVGYWLEPIPYLGFEVEVYHHREDIDTQTVTFTGNFPTFTDPFPETDVKVLAVGFNLMGRIPLLKSSAFPRGRVQPYAGVGLGIFRTKIEDEKDTAAGFQALAGLKAFLTKNLALFAEYKFTTHKPEVDLHFDGDTLEIETRLNTHYVYGGIAFHF